MALILIAILILPIMGTISIGSESVNDFQDHSKNNVIDAPVSNLNFEEFNFEFNYALTTTQRLGYTWDLITVENDDFVYNFIPGEPQVPIKSTVLETGYKIKDIEVKYSILKVIRDLVVEPAPELQVFVDRTIENDLEYTDYEISIRDYFAEDRYYPDYDYLITKLDSRVDHGESKYIYSFQLFPCKYNPGARTAMYYQNVAVKLFYDQTQNPAQDMNALVKPNSNTRNVHSSENSGDEGYDANEPENFELEGTVKYLVITTSKLIDELEPLVTWKERKGLTTQIIDINTIYNNQSYNGYDPAEELRNFIQYYYNNFGTEYVLLAGDYDTVPTRLCFDPDPYPGADDGEIPADSYYACISEGTTWDVDNDYIYGELGDLDDIYPDIMVGRIAINSEIKMKDWVDEVIKYECEPGAENWTDKVIMIGPNVHNTGDGAKQSEYFYNTYLKYVYNTFDKYYEDSEQGKPFSRSEVIKSINQGAAFLNYLGHGGPSTWTYNFGYSKLIDKGDVNKFTNRGMKPVVYAMSCLTGWFDDASDSGYGNFGDCIGETFTENVMDGGIGYIGSARTSVGVINQKYGPFATGLQEDYVRQLSQLNFGLGSSFTEAKKHYSEMWGNYFPDTNSDGEVQACWLEVNLLGEPELTLWTKRPEVFNISNITNEDTLIIIVENSTGQPVKNAQVCLQLTNSLGRTSFMDVKHTTSAGEAVFYIGGLPSRLNLTVTKTNFLPYLEDITIADQLPPGTTIEITPAKPDGENGWYVSPTTINLTPDEESITYYYWDDSPEEVYFGPIQVPEGHHELSYYSIDLSNNMEMLNKYSIKLDITPPVSQLELDPPEPNGRNGWYIVQPTINITKEPGATVYYSFDSELNITFSNPILAPVGVHQLNFYPKDIAGNLGESNTVTLKIDVVPAETELQITPKKPTGFSGWYTQSPTISFTTIDHEEEGVDIYYYWGADGSVTENKSSASTELPISDTVLFTNPITCPEGENILCYFSVDSAGCREDVNTYKIKLDTIEPVTDHTLSIPEPDGEDGYYVSDLEITLSSNEMGQLYYFWDDNYDQPYNKPIQALEGVHTLSYYAVDEAGNTGQETILELKVDTTLPTTILVLNPSVPSGNNGWYDITPTVSFETEIGATAYYHFEWFDDSIAPENIELPEGEIKIYFHSIDAAGNIGDETWELIKVDITTPIAKLEADRSNQIIGNVITFTAEESYDENDVKLYFFDFGDGENSGWISTSFVKHIYTKPGEYDVTLVVQDSAGLENEREEIFKVFITKEPEEEDLFSMDNLTLIITIIISVFIVLTGSFIFTYRRYSEPKTRPRQHPGIVMDLDYYDDDEYYDYDEDYEDYATSEPEIAEAIVINKPVVFKMERIRCPGCGKVFMSDGRSTEIKCPACGLKGEVEARDNSKDDQTNKIKRSKVQSSSKQQFKCPACDCLFVTSPGSKLVKCPECGIKGKI
jgi:phage FluMu protein Com